MGKMESALRDEIARLARKEVKAGIDPLLKEIKRLKEGQRTLKRATAKGVAPAKVKPPKLELPPEAEAGAARIGPRWIRALRKRNKISQGQLADLVGVSLSAVGSWEYGRVKPGGENKAKLVALRKMSKPEVKALLGGNAEKPKRKKATKKKTVKGKPKRGKKATKKKAKTPKKAAKKKAAKPRKKTKKKTAKKKTAKKRK